jgi:hypothetical protein
MGRRMIAQVRIDSATGIGRRVTPDFTELLQLKTAAPKEYIPVAHITRLAASEPEAVSQTIMKEAPRC